ncbi:hypothetical protein RMATCC62417_04977 [Rhizopus microsporus]|nr:hypothetical protein RMATCC62417_04977 [Rhizopus microsporus]
MSFHSLSESKFPSTNHLKEESLKETSLLDITDTPTVYSHPKDASTCIKPNCSAKSNTHIPTRIHKASSQNKLDLLFATRNDPLLEEKKLLIPTRLPAPPRRQLTTTEQPSTAEQLTPPSSPGGVQRRLRHAHIARLSRVQPSKEPTGKANQELAEFDPLISPIRSDNIKSIKDSLVTLVNSTAKSEQASLDQMSEPMKQERTMKALSGSNTRLPIPVQNRQSGIFKSADKGKCKNAEQTTGYDCSSGSSSSSSESECETQTPGETVTLNKQHKEDQMSIMQTTKLRKPEIFASKSVKSLPSYSSRFISCPTNDLLHDQLAKDREKLTKTSASLISAQGVISQPEEETASSSSIEPNRIEKIHERLQCLVEGEEVKDGSTATDYKKEKGTIEAMNVKMALHRFKPYLSPYEQIEILKYHSVYCVGSHAKKHWATTDQTTLNYGYDDEKGDYQIVIRDHLNYRYEIIESLGKGSFGQVVKCRDMKPQSKDKNQANNIVAVKIIRNKKRFHAQALTEIKILEKLMQLDPHNKYFIVRMLDNFYFRDHLCIVFECLSLNLYEVLQQNSYQGFSIGLVKRFAHQILSALKLLSDHKIIHCDLKPENILLKQPDKSGIKIIDFGSSCFVNERVYSYIQSRFYRAPEVILGLEYGLPIDMWSTGCILAELYTGRPLFPGENEPDQLACIMQLLGVPDKQYLDRCARKKQFFDMYDQPRKAINSKGKKRKPNSLTFTEALKRSSYDAYDREFVDFINKCLTWEPSERMTPEQALNHPWMKATKK